MTLAYDSAGCPSGLEPASSPADGAGGGAIDPAPFVSYRKHPDGGRVAHLELAVFGAKCAGCIRKIEGGLAALPGVDEARLNLSTGRLSVSWREGATPPALITRTLHDLGYRAAPFDPEKVESETDAEGRRLLHALGVAGFATANVMLLSVSVWAGEGEMGPATRDLLHWVSALIAIPCALFAGRPFFESALRSLSAGRANMDVPISLAVVLALGVSLFEFFKGGPHTYFDAAVMLLFFLLIGRYLDHRLRIRAGAAARDLLALQSTAANRIRADGVIEAVSAKMIAPGDRLLLSPGDTAPVDCVVEEGASTVNAALVTGESAPSQRIVGDAVSAGVLNISSRLVVRATKRADESLVAELSRLVEAGQQSKDRYVRLADKAAALYVPVVHSLAIATFAGWFFLADAGLRASVMTAVAVLIITCPCALGLAAPAVQVVATGRLFRAGVLVKTGDALERLAEIDTIVFDKTGTLTFGEARLTNRAEVDDETLEAASSLARISRHPLSRAIVREVGPGRADPDAVEFPGLGVEVRRDGVLVRLGRADWVGADAVREGDRLEAWFRRGAEPPVRLQFHDKLRADAGAVVKGLEARGVTVEMLSGDNAAAAAPVARALGIDSWRAEVTPQDKAARLRALADQGAKAAMVGDGLNDAASLAFAHVSLSPGGAADASQAAADFVYQGEGLRAILEAHDVARRARRRMLENFAFAAAYNAVAVPLAALGHVTPLIAALAMSGSSIIVTLNALRLAGRSGEATSGVVQVRSRLAGERAA